MTANSVSSIRRQPRMLAVVGVFYLATFLGSGLLLAVQPVVRLDPVILELVQFGPTLGVLAVLLVWRGRWRPPLVAGVSRRPDGRALAATVAAAALIFGLVLAIYAMLGRDVEYTGPSAIAEPFGLIVVAQLVGACGEELGWRSFLQPYLRTRFGKVTTGLLVGLLWGGWHVQYFTLGPAFAATFLVLTVALSVIMVVLVEAARSQQLLVAGSFHALINLGLLVLMPEEDGDLTAAVVLAIACVVTAVLVLLLARVGPPAVSRRGELVREELVRDGLVRERLVRERKERMPKQTALRATWRGLLAGGLALAEGAMAVVVVNVLSAFSIGVGLYLLAPSANGLRALANQARAWSDLAAVRPHPAPADRSLRAAARNAGRILADRAFWRELVWGIVDPLSGAILALVPASLVVYGVFGALVQPFVWGPIDRAGGSNWYGFIHVHTALTAALAVPLAVAFAALGLWSAPWCLRQQGRLTRTLLAPGRAELVERVERLTDTRAALRDGSAAEIRRIERDLHDGAQARLVAMGMTLDSAGRALNRDPEAARRLILEARDASSKALAELRDLVRGIHPPVLADRGLSDAVRALGLESPLNVYVDAGLSGRLSPPVESAAYFAISELMANVTKHAQATLVTIALQHEDDVLTILVTDDGRGGAPAIGTNSEGSGLLGIARRLAAFDGTITIDSPSGGPTTVRMEIPCESLSPKTYSS